MTIMETVILGVVSGSITLFLLFLAAKVFNNSFIPWLQSIRYKGIDVSGSWHSIPEGLNQIIEIELKQQASKLSGVATFVTKMEDSPYNPKYRSNHHYEKIRTFSAAGNIHDRFVTLNLKNVDPKRLGVTTLVLEVCGDGRKTQGAISFYSPPNDRISCCQLYFYRDPDQAQHASESPVDEEYLEKMYKFEQDYDEYEDALEEEPLNDDGRIVEESSESKA